MGFIVVNDREGRTHQLEAVEGWRVMEILRDYRLGIEGVCGGACSCATCHIFVDEDWADRVPAPRDEEIDMLDEVPGLRERSRLACQIIWDETLDGLKVAIAPEL